MNVMVLGASNKEHRYSNMAVKLLQQHGHRVIPVHPKLKEVDALSVINDISDCDIPVDTLTMYVNAQKSETLTNSILALKPKRVIFNPGSENPTLKTKLQNQGAETVEACTLVMLKTNQF